MGALPVAQVSAAVSGQSGKRAQAADEAPSGGQCTDKGYPGSKLVPYDKATIEGMIKEVYLTELGDKAKDLFTKAGYDMREFDLLVYEEPWYSKVFNAVFGND